jgi:hypothetical protein
MCGGRGDQVNTVDVACSDREYWASCQLPLQLQVGRPRDLVGPLQSETGVVSTTSQFLEPVLIPASDTGADPTVWPGIILTMTGVCIPGSMQPVCAYRLHTVRYGGRCRIPDTDPTV